MAGNYERMLDYYPLLIESAIDFKIESRKILAAHNGKCLPNFVSFFISLLVGVEPEITSDVETVSVAQNYCIIKYNN